MAEPEVVPALVALGFSLNESRAYAALLQESPATGYVADDGCFEVDALHYVSLPRITNRYRASLTIFLSPGCCELPADTKR